MCSCLKNETDTQLLNLLNLILNLKSYNDIFQQFLIIFRDLKSPGMPGIWQSAGGRVNSRGKNDVAGYI